MKKKIIIGSRRSKLALIYAKKAKEKLLNFLNNFDKEQIEIKEIVTKGDEIQDKRLSDLGGKGLFSKNIETQLLEKKIDIAIHALKDMPALETKGLNTNCFLERNDPREILISLNNKKLNELNKNAVIGTSSFRREFQLKKIRNDLNCKLIRGNVDTRISKLKNGQYDAIILSSAGINLLNLKNEITQFFSTSEIIPSAGQGIIALQCREEDKEMISLLKNINHEPTYYCALAERGVLKILEGDCETAIGVHAVINKQEIELNAELFSVDGSKRFHENKSKKIEFAKDLGKEVGIILKEKSNNSYKK